MFVHLHRKVRPFPSVSSGLNESDKSEKVGILTCAKTFFTPPQKISRTHIFKNRDLSFQKLQSAFFEIFENINFFHFLQLFSKLFDPFNFHVRAHIFSFPRFKPVGIDPDFPNSRVKKPQIQVIPHDDVHLSPARVWRVTRAQTCARAKNTHTQILWVGRKIRGFRKTEQNQDQLAGVAKTLEHPKIKIDKPLLLPSSIFRFFILPKCTPKCLFFCTIFPFWSDDFCEAPFFQNFQKFQKFQFVHFLHFLKFQF